jgi:hypothetical protein
MLVKEIIVVYSEPHKTHTYKLQIVKTNGLYNYQCAVRTSGLTLWDSKFNGPFQFYKPTLRYNPEYQHENFTAIPTSNPMKIC